MQRRFCDGISLSHHILRPPERATCLVLRLGKSCQKKIYTRTAAILVWKREWRNTRTVRKGQVDIRTYYEGVLDVSWRIFVGAVIRGFDDQV